MSWAEFWLYLRTNCDDLNGSTKLLLNLAQSINDIESLNVDILYYAQLPYRPPCKTTIKAAGCRVGYLTVYEVRKELSLLRTSHRNTIATNNFVIVTSHLQRKHFTRRAAF